MILVLALLLVGIGCLLLIPAFEGMMFDKYDWLAEPAAFAAIVCMTVGVVLLIPAMLPSDSKPTVEVGHCYEAVAHGHSGVMIVGKVIIPTHYESIDLVERLCS